MRFLTDRYTGKQISEKNLPEQIDFGRYFISENCKNPIEITYSNCPTNKVIRQELLLDKNKSLQDIFIDISIDISKSVQDEFNVIPLIRRIKNKLGLNEFELLLYDKIFHLEEIFRLPHYLLEREIEKVSVSRAKRIPSKSYQYLASHTEDWIHKSIVSFKPSRILNEELELNFDVFENQLAVAFLERCLVYLNSRIKEVQDIQSFLREYQKLLQNRKDEKGWYKKVGRNLKLIGGVYDDEHYHARSKDGSTLTETEEILNQLNKRLLCLRKSDLFQVVNKRASQTIVLRNTNVLVNHKHYRYLKSLWLELDFIKPVKSEKDKLHYEQSVFKGLVSYANSLFAYCVKEYLEYNIYGNYCSFNCEHLHSSKILFSKDPNGIIHLKFVNITLDFIVIANEPSEPEILDKIMQKENAYILYYSENSPIQSDRLININPLDPDSAERIGMLIRKYLLKEYLDNLNKKYEFKQMLRDYIHYISCNFLEFDTKEYTYKFIAFPHSSLKSEDIQSKLEEDKVYKAKSRPDKDTIVRTTAELVDEINAQSEKLKKEFLNCFHCGTPLNAHLVSNLNYIKCPECNGLLDSSRANEVIFKVDDPKVSSISKFDFGMDYLEYNISEL